MIINYLFEYLKNVAMPSRSLSTFPILSIAMALLLLINVTLFELFLGLAFFNYLSEFDSCFDSFSYLISSLFFLSQILLIGIFYMMRKLKPTQAALKENIITKTASSFVAGFNKKST
jgi:hypothetical protein